jgi:hypothetical protein
MLSSLNTTTTPIEVGGRHLWRESLTRYACRVLKQRAIFGSPSQPLPFLIWIRSVNCGDENIIMIQT